MPFGTGRFGDSTFGGGTYYNQPIAVCEVAFPSDPAATPAWMDVSAWLQSFTLDRGRQQELNRMEAATATIVLDNLDRRFDPSNAASPYAPNVVPVRRVRLSAVWNSVVYRLFSGYVETWPPTYPGPVDSNVTITATDAFKVFNLKKLNTSYPAELSSARIIHVLNDIGWPAADRVIATGDSTVQAVTLVNVPALQHLGDVVDAENGLLFMNGAGQVVFVNRLARVVPPYTVSQGTFGDGVGELLYVDCAFDYSDVQLWNDVRITRTGGTEQVAADTGSQTRYYPRTYSKTGTLMNTDPDALAAAQWLLGRYKAPALRVSSIVLNGEANPTTHWPQLFARELGDRVTVFKTPPGGGGRITQIGAVEHIEHVFSAEGGAWQTTWQLSPADLQLYWILGDTVQGVLGSTTVLSF